MKKTNTGMRFIDPTGEILIEKIVISLWMIQPPE